MLLHHWGSVKGSVEMLFILIKYHYKKEEIIRIGRIN